MPELSRLADDIFDRTSVYPGEGFRNHCLRLAAFARLHARAMGVDFDDEMVHAGAMIHDLGILVPRAKGTSYIDRSIDLARAELYDRLDSDHDRALLEQVLRFNHSLRHVPGTAPLTEAFRRAVFTEHSHGRRRYSLPRDDVKVVLRDLPQDNFRAVLADFFYRTLVFEPLTLRHIFIPAAPAADAASPRIAPDPAA
jgi:hypothetical protein